MHNPLRAGTEIGRRAGARLQPATRYERTMTEAPSVLNPIIGSKNRALSFNASNKRDLHYSPSMTCRGEATAALRAPGLLRKAGEKGGQVHDREPTAIAEGMNFPPVHSMTELNGLPTGETGEQSSPRRGRLLVAQLDLHG